MNYETIKSFILFVLVGISFLLSFILWSYQPNYDKFSDTSYVSEVDVGGQEKTKNELVEPIKIVFKDGGRARTFIDPKKRRNLYKDMASWVMSDVQVQNANGRPTDNQYTELVFPTNIPADLLTHLFTFNDELDTPDWSFDRVFLLLNDESKSVDVMVLSKDQQKQLTARVDKAETYQLLQSYIFAENDLLRENIVFGSENNPIYLPEDEQELPKKTVIASEIDPELFINALFSNPSLVTPNTGEAYFTDGQRGMRIAQDGRRLEFINPLQSNYERLDAIELIEKSVNNIDEHKGWTNNYMFDHVNRATNNIRYRLTYDSYPVFDQNNLSTMEQEWRDQELYQYKRPLIEIGSLLNSENVTLPSGEEVEHWLLQDQDKFNINEITDIRIGYYLSYADDTHSLTLEPNWFILYENDWIKFDLESVREDNNQRGEG